MERKRVALHVYRLLRCYDFFLRYYPKLLDDSGVVLHRFVVFEHDDKESASLTFIAHVL